MVSAAGIAEGLKSLQASPHLPASCQAHAWLAACRRLRAHHAQARLAPRAIALPTSTPRRLAACPLSFSSSTTAGSAPTWTFRTAPWVGGNLPCSCPSIAFTARMEPLPACPLTIGAVPAPALGDLPRSCPAPPGGPGQHTAHPGDAQPPPTSSTMMAPAQFNHLPCHCSSHYLDPHASFPALLPSSRARWSWRMLWWIWSSAPQVRAAAPIRPAALWHHSMRVAAGAAYMHTAALVGWAGQAGWLSALRHPDVLPCHEPP